MPSRLLIEELPITNTKPSAPGWAYVPDVAPLAAQVPGQRKRAAAQRHGANSSAKREKAIERRLEALNRENYKDVHIPIPKTNRERDQKKVTPNVRRILGYNRTFAHYLADEEATVGQGKSVVIAGEKLPAKTTSRIDPAKRKSRLQEISSDDEPSPSPPPPLRVRTPQPGPMKGRVLAVRCDECKRRKKRCTHMDIAEEQTAARARQMESPQPPPSQSRRAVGDTSVRKLVDTPRTSRASETKSQNAGTSVRKKASMNAMSQARSTPSKVAKIEPAPQIKKETTQEDGDTVMADAQSSEDVTMTETEAAMTQDGTDSATAQADSYPKEWDDDPLLRSDGVPVMPSEKVMQILLSEPPLSYSAARATPLDEEHRPPSRNFCAICGYWGRVKCGKCGEWTCGIMECWKSHEGVCEMAQYG